MKVGASGFSLVELLIVVTIMVILYTLTPNVIQEISGPKSIRAKMDAEAIAAGLWGSTEDQNGSIGDIGLTVANPQFINITTTVGLPIPAIGAARRAAYLGVSGGWYGAYAGFGSNSLVEDPWQTPWQIDVDGKVRSAGPDRVMNTSDDIVAPNGSPTTMPSTGAIGVGPMYLGQTGSVYITVVDLDGSQLFAIGQNSTPSLGPPVTVNVTNANPTSTPPGQMTLEQATWNPASNNFVATGLWPGLHAIEVRAGCVSGSGGCTSVNGSGGNCSGVTVQTFPDPAILPSSGIPTSQMAFPEQATVASNFGTSTVYVNDCTQFYGHGVAYVIGGTYANAIVQIH